MRDGQRPAVAIIDYGVGNLFSVKNACRHAGLDGRVTSVGGEIRSAEAVILPGVGAFGDAMRTLNRLGLSELVLEAAQSGKPVLGICLGMQLLMTESSEFGRHGGLGIIPGSVVRLDGTRGNDPVVKVPQVCWSRLRRVEDRTDAWAGTLLSGLPDAVFMYFVHSYYVKPEDESVTLARTEYGRQVFCSALQRGNVFACQFHPERSGPLGLRVYENLAQHLRA